MAQSHRRRALARFGNDIVLDVGKHLRDLLPHAANNFSPRRLQLRQPRFDHVRLLAALEIFAALADPFLPFQNQVGELIGQFLRDEFQQAQAENEIDLDIFVIFGLGQRALQQVGQQLAERRIVQALVLRSSMPEKYVALVLWRIKSNK